MKINRPLTHGFIMVLLTDFPEVEEKSYRFFN